MNDPARTDQELLPGAVAAHARVIRAAIELCADPDAVDASGTTAQMLAARHPRGHDAVDILLEQAVDAILVDDVCATTLHHACWSRVTSLIVHALLRNGAHPVRALGDAGASVDLRDDVGLSAVDHAEAVGSLDAVAATLGIEKGGPS